MIVLNMDCRSLFRPDPTVGRTAEGIPRQSWGDCSRDNTTDQGTAHHQSYQGKGLYPTIIRLLLL